jgi:MoaA/NifB/PqqE/SkfB family radical SAM enzyme
MPLCNTCLGDGYVGVHANLPDIKCGACDGRGMVDDPSAQELRPEVQKARDEVAALFEIDKFTCDDCPRKNECMWAFDAYNTDGDCLADK